MSSVLLFYLLFQWLLFNEGCEQCFTFQLIVSIVFVKVVCSDLLFNVLFQLFLFNEGGVQCFTFQLIVSIVLWRWCAVFYFSTYYFNCFCLMKVVSSVLLFNLLFQLFFVSLRWWAVFYFSTYCFNGFYLMKVVSSVLLFNLLFLLFLWR